MKCANPECSNNLLYLRGGTLRLLELDGPLEKRLLGEPAGFPVFVPRSRYFWLCGDCSKKLVIKRWTNEGLVLESRQTSARGKVESWVVVPRPAVGEASVLHFQRPMGKPA